MHEQFANIRIAKRFNLFINYPLVKAWFSNSKYFLWYMSLLTSNTSCVKISTFFQFNQEIIIEFGI